MSSTQIQPQTQTAVPTATSKPVVLVTGVSGLIGSRLADALAPSYRVVGLDVKPPSRIQAEIDWIEADMTKDAAVGEALQQVKQKAGERIASVVHLAAYYDFSGEPSPMYDELTVQGTRRLLQGLRDFQVEQFIFSSSLLVMKPAEEGRLIDESSPLEPKWDYPRSKVEAEQVIARERGEVPVVIARIAGVYDEDGHSLPVGQQMARIYEKQLESYLFPGNPHHGQAFVHLGDLFDSFALMIEKRRELGSYEVFLIAEPEVVSYAAMQEIIGESLHGEAWPTIRIPRTVAKAGAWVKNKLASKDDEQFIKPWMIDLADEHFPINITKARTQLGWAPKHRLRDVLPEMAKRLREHPREWYERNKLPLPDSLAEKEAKAR